MAGTLETLRNTLLLTLIVILLYVMYKRLLRLLGKDDVNRARITFSDHAVTHVEGEVRIGFHVPSKTKVTIEVSRNRSDAPQVLIEGDFDAGNHEVLADISRIGVGRHFIVLRSDDHVIYRSFTLI